MKSHSTMTNMIACVSILLTLSATAIATPPAAFFYFENGVLTENGLDKGTPLPDSTVVKIFWDVNDNGPDDKDPQPVVGAEFGNANINSFYMNGESDMGVRGQFASSPGFGTIGNIMDPPRYYLKICLDDKSLVSDVHTLVPGLQDVIVKSWSIGPKCKIDPR